MPRPRTPDVPRSPGRLLFFGAAAVAVAVAALLWLALSDDGGPGGDAALVSGRDAPAFRPELPDAAGAVAGERARIEALADELPSAPPPTAAGAGPPGSVLGGRVARRDGSPVTGATVFAERDMLAAFDRVHAWTLGGPEAVTTGPDGRFEVDVPARSGASRAFLFVGRDRSDQDLRSITVEPGARRELGTIVLEPGGLVQGRVVGAAGEAVAGAEVRVQGHFVLRVETDPGGRFAFGGLAAGDVRVEVTSRDHEELVVDDVAVTPGRVNDLGALRLRPGRRIAGVLVTPGGDPLPGQTVWARATDAWSRSTDGRARSQGKTRVETTTDAEGRFVFGGLAEGVFDLHAAVPGQALSHLREVRTGQTVRFELRRSAALLLELRDAVSGAAVHPAEVEAVPRLVEGVLYARHAVSGGGRTAAGDPEPHRVDGIGEEPVTLKVQAEGYASRVLEVMDMQPGEVRRQTLLLEPDVVVAGRVTDYGGEPVTGVQLFFTAEPGNGAFADRQAAEVGRVHVLSDADGAFEVDGLSRGLWRLRVRLPEDGHVGPPETTLDLRNGGLERLSIRLLAYASLSGRLLSPTGESAAGRAAVAAALVEERPWPSPVPLPSDLEITSRIGSKPLPRSRVLGFDGGRDHYTLTGLTPGVYRIQATTADPRIASQRLAVIEAPLLPPEVVTVELRGGEVRGMDLQLALPGSVRGRVLVSGASPAAGVVVLATADQPARIVGKAGTDGSGAYAFEEVAAGEYVVVAAVQGHPVPRVRSLAVGAGQHLLADFAFAGHTLRGRVVDMLTGAPAAGAEVSVRGRETGPAPSTLYGLSGNLPSLLRQGGGELFDQTTRADAGGRFWIEGLPAATYWLSAAGDVWRSAGESQVRIDDLWSPEEVVVKVRAAAGLEGWVSYETGGAADDTLRAVLVAAPNGDRRGSMQLVDGRYVFSGLAPGNYELRIEDLGIWDQDGGPKPLFQQSVELVAGTLQRLDVVLGR